MELTRAEIFRRDNPGEPLPLNETIVGSYIIDIFRNLGMFSISGGERCRLTFSEIAAYSQTVNHLIPQEVLILRNMSNAYLQGIHKGQDECNIPPWRQ